MRGLHGLLFPAEIAGNARPAFDLSIADRAFEAAGLWLRVLLPSRDVPHAALRAFESFVGPCPAGHAKNMRSESALFQPVALPQLN